VTRAAPAIAILAVALPVSLAAGILVGAVPLAPTDVLGALLGGGVAERGVEDARQQAATAEAAGLGRRFVAGIRDRVLVHGPEHGIGPRSAQ
jgi:hypothetical protein